MSWFRALAPICQRFPGVQFHRQLQLSFWRWQRVDSIKSCDGGDYFRWCEVFAFYLIKDDGSDSFV